MSMSQAKWRKNVIKRNQVKLRVLRYTRPKTVKMSSPELHNIMLINLMCKYWKNSISTYMAVRHSVRFGAPWITISAHMLTNH